MNIYLKTLGFIALVFASIPAMAQDKPNILVIWGDDIGYFNVGAYNRGAMGWAEQLYGRKVRFHYGPESISHRPPESWFARRKRRST